MNLRKCPYCLDDIPTTDRHGKPLQPRKYLARKTCDKSACRSTAWKEAKLKIIHPKRGASYPEKRQCEECGDWYGRRVYASGQIEPPCNFLRRETCGKHECVLSRRRKKTAENKAMQKRQIKAVDLFIYGEKAIKHYHRIMEAA